MQRHWKTPCMDLQTHHTSVHGEQDTTRSTGSCVLQFQGELPSVLGSSLDELMRHVGSLRSQVLEVVIKIYSMLCELGSSSPIPAQEACSQVAMHQLL